LTPLKKYGLTAREKRCAVYIAEGLSDKEIGEKLGHTHSTVQSVVRRILRKMDAPNRAKVAAIVTEARVRGAA
jgi:DNA-binding CsgD family transcriptional regulator